MAHGARVEVSINASQACPIVRQTTASGTAIDAVARSAAGDALVEDVVVHHEDSGPNWCADEVFSVDDEHVYRFERNRDDECPCNRIERHGCPIKDLHFRNGEIWILFYVASLETAHDVIEELTTAYSSVSIRRILQACNGTDSDLIFIDRNEFTDRQKEVLRTAHEMGYFEHPRDANASDVAEELGISVATFTEHLAVTQRKLTKGFLSD